MNNLTISIIGNQIFSNILNELKSFSKLNIKYYDKFDLCEKQTTTYQHIFIFFINEENEKDYVNAKKNNLPIIAIAKPTIAKNIILGEFVEYLNFPFRIQELEKKIIILLSRYEYKKSSLIKLGEYIIDKNERKIKKKNLELQLTEREVNFLVLFSKNNKPISRNFVLQNVWNYSPKSDTHTIETHIHRLRKKIFDKFKDKNFIKNNNKGYYI